MGTSHVYSCIAAVSAQHPPEYFKYFRGEPHVCTTIAAVSAQNPPECFNDTHTTAALLQGFLKLGGFGVLIAAMVMAYTHNCCPTTGSL